MRASVKRQGRRYGSVLLLSLFFLLVMSFLATAFATLIPVDSQAAVTAERDVRGQLVADAGVSDAVAWLRSVLQPADGSASKEPMATGVYPSSSERTATMKDGWSYHWKLIPDSQTYPNGNNPIRAYTIVSTSSREGTPQRIVKCEVVQDSLANKDGSDTWPSDIVQPIGVGDIEPLPAFTNGKMRLWLYDGNSYWKSTGSPYFTSGVMAHGKSDRGGAAGDGFVYYQGNWGGSNPSMLPYKPGVGPIASRYKRMANGGRQAMQAGVPIMPFPKNTFNLKQAAWGFSGDPYPGGSTGVHIHVSSSTGKVDGGVLINGDVKEMQLGPTAGQVAAKTDTAIDQTTKGPKTINYGNNSWVKISQGSQSIVKNDKDTTVVSVTGDKITLPTGTVLNGKTITAPRYVTPGYTLVRNQDGTFDEYPGKLNGVVFATGNINDLWGTNKGRRTVAVQMNKKTNTKHSVYIGGKLEANGSMSNNAGEKGLLVYGATDANGDGILDPPTNSDNALGVVGYNVMVSKYLRPWTQQTKSNPLYIYGSLFGGWAGSDGGVGVQDYGSGSTQGGWVYRYGGTLQANTLAWGYTSGQGLTHGHTYGYPGLGSSPPPFFPALPSFHVVSYEESLP